MVRRGRAAAVLGLVVVGSLAAPPGLAEVPADETPPTVSIEGRKFAVGTRIIPSSGDPDAFCRWTVAPMDLIWRGSDEEPGIAGYTVSSQAAPPDPDSWQVVVPDTARTKYRTSGEDRDCFLGEGLPTFFKVDARDGAGNTASSVDSFGDIGVWQEDGTSFSSVSELEVTTTGRWRRASCACSDAGHTAYSTDAGASVSYTSDQWTSGRWVALVMAKNTDHGELTVRVDGRPPVLVDTFSERQRDGVIVWQHRFGNDRPHTITVTNLGTPSRSRIDMDSVLQAFE